jgi:hypothetical protein
MRRAHVGTILAGSLILSALSGASLAYILPSSAILAAVGARRKALDFEALVIRGKLLNPQTNVPEKTVWKLIKPGQGIRTEIKGPHTTEVTLLAQGKRYEFSPGTRPGKGLILKGSLDVDFLAATQGDSAGKRGLSFLASHKIDRKIVSLSRMDRRLIWVIGALEGDHESPQLWIDKNLKVPVRLVYNDKASGEKIDIRWLGFGSPQTREWHPRQIDTYKNGALLERLVFHRVIVNPSVDSALLAPPKTN